MDNDISKIHKPNRMVNKIHKAIKREYNLYHQPTYHVTKGFLKNASEGQRNAAFKRIVTNLWYKHCGMTQEELFNLVAIEYNNFKLWEILDAS